MTRYALVLGSRSCPTLSAAAVCPSLDICTALTPHKTITVLYKPALWVLWWLETEDWPFQTILAVEADLRPMNLGLATSQQRVQVRSTWRKLIATATSTTSSWTRRKLSRVSASFYQHGYEALLTAVVYKRYIYRTWSVAAFRAFAVAGPKAWNQLPMHIRARESVGLFKTALKSHFHFVDILRIV